MNLSNQLTKTTVFINCIDKNGNNCTGTGYFFQFKEENNRYIPCIVTNKHVVKDTMMGQFRFTVEKKDDQTHKEHYIDYKVTNFERFWIPHPEPSVDLCILPIKDIMEDIEKKGCVFAHLFVEKSLIQKKEVIATLSAIEDIIMIGYPSGIWDAINNRPIVRKGITATHPYLDYNGKSEFMIDAACFPGSSGSPVFLYNQGNYTVGDTLTIGSRLILLGTLYAGPQQLVTGEFGIVNIPTRQQAVTHSMIPINLGMVIKAQKILDFESIL